MLHEAIDLHRGAFEHDWRQRFGVPLSAMPEAMDWGEGYRLMVILANDPSSWVCAALNDWRYPLSREGLVALDLYDLQHASKAKKRPRPYMRPWDKKPNRYGTPVSIAEWKRLKARHQTEAVTDG